MSYTDQAITKCFYTGFRVLHKETSALTAGDDYQAPLIGATGQGSNQGMGQYAII